MSLDLKILLVDDDPDNIARLQQALDGIPCETIAAGNGEQALTVLSRLSDERGFPGIVVTDMKMPVMGGLELLERIRATDPDLPVLLITAYGNVASAVRAMKDGAYDFLERPFDIDLLTARVTRALEGRRVVLELRSISAGGMAAKLVGRAAGVVALRDRIAKLAATDASVLIHGETGSGKEVVARCLHEFSRRKSAHFVAINCAALSDTLLEAELFGHEAGAFTGAVKRRIGKLEFARGGTVFLDEIESMPLDQQAKILRALDAKEIERLGSNERIKVDFRIVAATKTDLKEAGERKEFREDLYYRLNVAELRIPPLRERREDIPLLFEHFLGEAATKNRCGVPELTQAGRQALLAHDWPGNVRELRNVAERFVLGLDDIEGILAGGAADVQTLPEQVAGFETALIAQALADNEGSIQHTADALGVPRRTLNDKMNKYGLDKEDYR